MVGIWVCDSVWDPGFEAVKFFGICGCFIVKFWKGDVVRNELQQVGEKFQFLGYYQSGRKVVGM